jgi:hypothetical protein
LRWQTPMRRFVLKRLGSLASPFPKQPRLDTRRPPDEFTALGRDTPGAYTGSEHQIAGVGERLPRHTPSSLKHGKRIVGQKLESGDISNRDFGCDMRLRACQAQCTRFWK